jgi:hypothetical protein
MTRTRPPARPTLMTMHHSSAPPCPRAAGATTAPRCGWRRRCWVPPAPALRPRRWTTCAARSKPASSSPGLANGAGAPAARSATCTSTSSTAWRPSTWAGCPKACWRWSATWPPCRPTTAPGSNWRAATSCWASSHARAEFEFVLRYNPPAACARNINGFLQAMQVRESGSSRAASSRLYVEAGLGHDNNVNGGTFRDEMQLVFRQRQHRLALQAIARQLCARRRGRPAALMRVTQRLSVFAGADLDHRAHFKEHDYDISNGGLNAGFTQLSGNALWRTTLAANEMRVGGRRYRDTLSVGTEANFTLDADQSVLCLCAVRRVAPRRRRRRARRARHHRGRHVHAELGRRVGCAFPGRAAELHAGRQRRARRPIWTARCRCCACLRRVAGRAHTRHAGHHHLPAGLWRQGPGVPERAPRHRAGAGPARQLRLRRPVVAACRSQLDQQPQQPGPVRQQTRHGLLPSCVTSSEETSCPMPN